MNPWVLVGVVAALVLRNRSVNAAPTTPSGHGSWWVLAPLSLQGVWVPGPEGVGRQMTAEEAAQDQLRRDMTLAGAEISSGFAGGALGLGLGTTVGTAILPGWGTLGGAAVGGTVGLIGGGVLGFGAQLANDLNSNRGALLFV